MVAMMPTANLSKNQLVLKMSVPNKMSSSNKRIICDVPSNGYCWSNDLTMPPHQQGRVQTVARPDKGQAAKW